MSNHNHDQLARLLELANHYPSPHNGQPMVITSTDGHTLHVLFDTRRGLTATPISHLFSFATIGVFVRHFELCAQALGHGAKVQMDLPPEEAMGQGGAVECGRITLNFDTLPPDAGLERLIRSRQTSRKKYTAGLSPDQAQTLEHIATGHHLTLAMVEPEHAREVIWLNQRAVFDDMFDHAVRTELNHWMRYSAQEKATKRDGLAYDCMELSGTAMKFAVDHYRVLRWPVIAPLLRQYYLRTMADASTVGYITSPFETTRQSYEIGRCIIDIWIELTRAGAYLHPFGTIVSNPLAHQDFAELVGLENEARASNYVVFIFRAGFSPAPVPSLRIPPQQHLYKGSGNA